MSTIAYVGLPAHGHTNPTLPVMQQLVSRGHRVLYYNAESFRAKVVPTGVDFRALPEPMPNEREVAEALHTMVNAALILSEISRPLARFLIGEFGTERPDVVIYDSAAMWGYVAARSCGVPNICFITTFVLDGSQGFMGWRMMVRFIASALPHAVKLLRWRRGMAQEFGEKNSEGLTAYADLNIVFTSRAFHPPNSFIDGRFAFVGPSLDPKTRETSDFPFERLDQRPLVYISLGTINHLNTPFYRAAFDAFGDYPAQFVLSAGKHTDVASLGDVPDNFLVRRFVPQLEILQRAAAFVTHGGMNSVHEALYYGVPLIVVPHHLEQWLNGKRVAQTGSGVMLEEKRPLAPVTPTDLQTALDTVLNAPHYRENAAQIGVTLRNAGGFQRAVNLIENFVLKVGKRVAET